jgi:hypothetical protein
MHPCAEQETLQPRPCQLNPSIAVSDVSLSYSFRALLVTQATMRAGVIAGKFLYLPKSTAPQAKKAITSPMLSHRNRTCNRLTATTKAAFFSANSANACAICCFAI